MSIEINADYLTVGELREKLNYYPSDMIVVSNVSYGDRYGTQQAIFVDEVEYAAITETSYSQSGFKVIDTMDEDEDCLRVLSLNFGAIE